MREDTRILDRFMEQHFKFESFGYLGLNYTFMHNDVSNVNVLFSTQTLIATLGSNLGISALLEILQDASWTTKWYYNH